MSNYQVHVSASPRSIRDDPSLPHPLMHVTYIIRSSYESSDPSPSWRIFDRDSVRHFQCVRFVSTDSSPGSLSWGFISFTLDNLQSPFPLDRLRWIDLDDPERTAQVGQTRDEIVSEILNVAWRAVNDPCNEGRKRFGISVDITKVVTLPWNAIREMGQRPREVSMWRGVQETVRRSEAASGSAIWSLEKAATPKRRDPGDVCAICLEELAVGDEVSRTGCSHEFHSSCIEKWLRIAHTCPTCRHELSTS